MLVLKKSKKDKIRTFIDASAEFVRWANKNKLTDDHRRRSSTPHCASERCHFAKLASHDEIMANDKTSRLVRSSRRRTHRQAVGHHSHQAEIAQ